MGNWVFANLPKLFAGVIGFILITVAWAGYDEYTAEKFYLRKDSWRCTAQHLTATQAGDVLVTGQVCDRWERL